MAKGGANENTIGKELSLLWSNGKRDDLMTRSDGSGSRFSKKKKQGKDATIYQGGDLTFADDCIKPLVQLFSIEAKHGYSRKSKTKDGVKVVNWCVLDVIDSKQKEPMFLQMWNQCKRDAELSNRNPLLIFRRDNMQICITFERTMYNSFINYFGYHQYKTINVNFDINEYLVLMNFNDWKSWVGDSLESFVNVMLSQKHGVNYDVV